MRSILVRISIACSLLTGSTQQVNAHCGFPISSYYHPHCPIFIPCQPIFIPCHPIIISCPYPTHSCQKPSLPCDIAVYVAWNGKIRVGPAGPGGAREFLGRILDPISLVEVTTPLLREKLTVNDPWYDHFTDPTGSTERWAIARYPDYCCKYDIYQYDVDAQSWKKRLCAERKCVGNYSDTRLPIGRSYDTFRTPRGAERSELLGQFVTNVQSAHHFREKSFAPQAMSRNSTSVDLEVGKPLKAKTTHLTLRTEPLMARPLVDRSTQKTRMTLRGRWFTPAETKILVKWNEADTSNRWQVVQVLPKTSEPLRSDGQPLVSALEALDRD